MINLENDSDRRLLALRIKDDIDAYAQQKYDKGHRSHLGASVIGQQCLRATWYSFRWAKRGASSGRMQRLFQRGHLEEKRFIEYLRGIGFTVQDLEADGSQFRVTAIGGHFGGSLDSILIPPASYEIQQPIQLLGEYKTKGTGSGFNKLVSDGIEVTNYQHFVQMCIYGYFRGLDYAIYFAVNKNDDDLHVEVVQLKRNVAEQYLHRATDVIRTKVAPARVSSQSTFWLCKGCSFADICWHGGKPQQNCRSCVFASAADNGQWYCDGWKGIIPDNVMPVGCTQWVPIS